MSDTHGLDQFPPTSFPELANALRLQTLPIIHQWVAEIRHVVPQVRDRNEDEAMDHLPLILPQIAAVLETSNSEEISRLLSYSPAQGMTRFQQQYGIRELFTEDRILRKLVVEKITAALGREMMVDEQTALHMAIDLMLQQSVVSYVDEQQERLRAASEKDLRQLSFLSHDLRNNLGSVTLWLQLVRQELLELPNVENAIEAVDMAQQTILNTIGGMGRLLQAEQLREDKGHVQMVSVDLHPLVTRLCRRYAPEAEKKGLNLVVDVPIESTIDSDAELLTIVLQNLLGNAIKYCSKGTVTVWSRIEDDNKCVLAVSDEGPGIGRNTCIAFFKRSAAAKPTVRKGSDWD